MSKRNAMKNSLPGSNLTIGLDIGYGVVKAVTSDQVVMFPSVTGHAPNGLPAAPEQSGTALQSARPGPAGPAAPAASPGNAGSSEPTEILATTEHRPTEEHPAEDATAGRPSPSPRS